MLAPGGRCSDSKGNALTDPYDDSDAPELPHSEYRIQKDH